ncbi:hypothetical protein HDA45_004184 [Amycolatopsis umgeniensis]|uniref:Uncharacterized protein n=1 Tax=Amycolatopsis umgeniensis TaxID=336628 RepID=A0A841B454_9PSEU|nr:hypothetical protein [Amycolatopsis umgeniensis]
MLEVPSTVVVIHRLPPKPSRQRGRRS